MEQPFNLLQKEFNKSALHNKEVLSPRYWEELRTFLTVAREGSFSQAAEVLNTTHPTVSRQVKRLEDMTGLKLYVTASTGIFLTEAGQKLALRAAQVDNLIHQLSDELAPSQDVVSGCVRVSVTEGLGAFWIAPHLVDVAKEHKTLELKLLDLVNFSSFRENNADVLVGFIPTHGKDIVCRQIGTLHFIPVASADYIQQYGLPTLNNLSSHRFVQLQHYSTAIPFWQTWNQRRLQGTTQHEASNSIVYSMMIKSGYGIGLLGSYTVLDKSTIPLDLGFSISVPLYAMALKDRLQLPHIRFIFDSICDLFGPSNPWFQEDMDLSPKATAWDARFKDMLNLEMF